MKKIVLTAISLATLSTQAFSFTPDFIQDGYYGGVGMGIENFSTYSSYDPGLTLVINGGKPIIKLGPGLIGAEAEFTYTAVPMSDDYYSDLSVATLGAYATYTYDLNEKFYAKGKLGLVARNYSWDNGSYTYSDYTRVGEAIGIGVGYKYNQKMRVFSDLIVLDGADLKQMNFGVQMNF